MYHLGFSQRVVSPSCEFRGGGETIEKPKLTEEFFSPLPNLVIFVDYICGLY